jgi:hypothetical protein
MRSLRKEAEAIRGKKVLSIDLSGVSVLIAMPVYHSLSPQTALSLLKTYTAAGDYGIPLRVLLEPGISDVEFARCICVHRFLAESNATKLFCIDSDMEWEPDAFMRLISLSTKVDVVCGAYPRKSEPLEFLVGTPGRVTMNEYGCIPWHSGGLGFTVIDRKVIECLAEKAPRIKFDVGDIKDKSLPQLFHKGEDANGYVRSEDTSFFSDVRDAGFEIWCDPHIVLGHVGAKVYAGSLYDHMLQKQIAAE